MTNKSPLDYLNELRLKSAAEALKANNKLSVTDIGFEMGFRSSQYFSRRFSEYFGMSPSKYRKQQF
ncbi:helix-turn-helix domain-containing protein [Parasalinivibrio latis]|uniref:helix-turn-helix domain-containing protein n=1 Tax=Parasalinivibrio latis TaxID=2952610 RepID=UPI003DA6CCBC